MKGYFGLGQLSATEKQDILNQHKTMYNGYQTMQPQVSNTQPLYVFDPAGDKNGLVVNNKGEVKRYSNMGINEQVEEKEMCEQCGGTMREDICEQCGGKMEGKVEEGTGKLDDIYDVKDLYPEAGFDYMQGPSNNVIRGLLPSFTLHCFFLKMANFAFLYYLLTLYTSKVSQSSLAHPKH